MRARLVANALSLHFCLSASIASAADFRLLPILPNALSADGSVVVGKTFGGLGAPVAAAKWTAENGAESLIGEIETFEAYDVTPNGEAIVGIGIDSFGNSAFHWTASSGAKRIGTNDTKLTASLAISDDGRVIAGKGGPAFRWSATAGPEFATTQECGFFVDAGSFAVTMSADGGDVFFLNRDASDVDGPTYHLTRWNELGCAELDTGRTFSPNRLFASSDGRVLAGVAENRPLNHAEYPVRWTADVGVQELLPFPGAQGRSHGITADGKIIVGTAMVPDFGAFIWDERLGAQRLQDVLETQFDLADKLVGWDLTEARAISPDGRHIAGVAIGDDGVEHGFLATVPEPASAALALSGGAFCCLVRLRRRIGRFVLTLLSAAS